MGQIQLDPGSSATGAGRIVRESLFAVETCDTWGGTWIRRNWLYADHASLAIAPSVGEATFSYTYGEITRVDRISSHQYNPLAILDAATYIRVVELNTGLVWWTGIIDNESLHPFGGTSGTGDQNFGAWELTHLLERSEIDWAQASNGSGATVEIDWVPVVNKRDSVKAQRGNRSAGQNSDGIYEFSDDGDLWSNLEVIQMLLALYTPEDGPPFVLAGQYDALGAFHDTIDLSGLTVWNALLKLIDRRRGFGFVPIVTPTHVKLYVFTTVDSTVRVGGVEVPANPLVTTFDLDRRIELQNCKIVRSNAVRADQITVIGKRMLSCFTVARADGSLIYDWEAADQLAYDDGGYRKTGYYDLTDAEKEELNDTVRGSDRFATVYTRQRIPRNWNGTAGNGAGGGNNPVLPVCSDLGIVTVPGGAPFTPLDKKFEHWLPFEHNVDYSAGVPVAQREPTLMRPFAMVQDEEQGNWHMVDNPGPALKEDGCCASVVMYPTGCAIGINGSPNHAYALGIFDPENAQPTATEPKVRLSKTLATVAMYTDSALRVNLNRAGVGGVLKRKVIQVPDAEYWYVAPGTVLGLDTDGGLKRVAGAMVLRDDSDRLWEVAVQAYSWYGQERRSVMVEMQSLQAVGTLGTFLQSIVTAGTELRSNTILSSMSWDFKERRTSVETAWAEFDWEVRTES
jgi:hypothetical protein